MVKYKLVTGYYPSRTTAEKVLKKVRGNCKEAKIETFEDCFIVVLAQTTSYKKADDLFSEFMKKKIYCGIMAQEGVKDSIRK